MAIQWLRLWHELPTDPKWRTIARISGQSIGDVISTYIFVLVSASNGSERGRTEANAEDIATALDLDTPQVEKILAAMQGRVIDGTAVSGWDKRQPKDEGSATRAKEWRERKRTEANGSERKQTEANTDKDKEEEKEKIKPKTLVELPAANSTDTVLVFDHWRMVMGHEKAKLDAKRKKNITARLKDGYSVQDLKEAIEGCFASPFHQGDNDRGQKYHDIELICREAKQVDKFREIFAKGAPVPPQKQPIKTGRQAYMANLVEELQEKGIIRGDSKSQSGGPGAGGEGFALSRGLLPERGARQDNDCVDI